MSRDNAANYCKEGAARLPSVDEVKQLAKFLGQNTAQGYSPYLADGKIEVLTDFTKDSFWLDTDYGSANTHQGQVFHGRNNRLEVWNRYKSESVSVRCVSQRSLQ